jgi:ABC-2 type transport system ATP-binding protein
MIRVSTLTKNYGQNRALNNVSFEINKGEVVGLLGPNGAGKTTALNIITGVLYPDQGEVFIDDHKRTQSSVQLSKKIGYLSEDNPQYPNLLVSESLELTAELKNLDPTKYQARLAEVMKVTGLSEIFHQTIENLSKGLRQRVGLAQALLTDPEVLILDEPTDGLDANQRQEIRNLIKDLGREHTVLLSTHIMQEVEAVCERVIILNRGQVVADGTVTDITKAQDGWVEIEFNLVGDDPVYLLEQIKEAADKISNETGLYIARLEADREKSFYQKLNEVTSGKTYVTHLNKRQISLEDVFRKLTKET